MNAHLPFHPAEALESWTSPGGQLHLRLRGLGLELTFFLREGEPVSSLILPETILHHREAVENLAESVKFMADLQAIVLDTPASHRQEAILGHCDAYGLPVTYPDPEVAA